ncbi:Serine/threonine-protein kinase STY13 [Linum grandiflorum]
MEENPIINHDDDDNDENTSSSNKTTAATNDTMITTTSKRKVMAMVDLKKNLDRLDRHLDRVGLLLSNKNGGGATATTTTATEATVAEWDCDVAKLVVGKLIGRGACAAVYRGTYDGKEVAVKMLEYWKEEGDEEDGSVGGRRRAQLMSRLRHEASLWHKLCHPNVCEFIGAVTASSASELNYTSSNIRQSGNLSSDPACCLLTRYHSGGTLKSYLENYRRLSKKLPLEKVLNLALQLAKGIEYIHSLKLIHRDVKPENVVLESNRKALKIIDFGVARMEPAYPSEMAGQIGTIGYMAPEVFERIPYDRKCDVYSFGISLWEIYCCNASFANYGFTEDTSASVYRNVRPEIPRNCPEKLADVMQQCWEIDPKRRPEMREVVSMLEEISPRGVSKRTLLSSQCFCIRREPCSNI